MNKTITLVVLVTLLVVLAGLIYANRDKLNKSFPNQENQVTQTEPTPTPTLMPTPTPSEPVNINVEVQSLDTTLNSINPDELDGSDLTF